jgi:hypothetical protein
MNFTDEEKMKIIRTITILAPGEKIIEVIDVLKKIDPTWKDGNYHCDICRWVTLNSSICNKCGSGYNFDKIRLV